MEAVAELLEPALCDHARSGRSGLRQTVKGDATRADNTAMTAQSETAPKQTKPKAPKKATKSHVENVLNEGVAQARMWMRRNDVDRALTILESADARIQELVGAEPRRK